MQRIIEPGSRLRTLIGLRWMAILGQVAAITVAGRHFGLILQFDLCYMAVGASVIANMVSIFVFPENRRLSDHKALLTLLFDLARDLSPPAISGRQLNRLQDRRGSAGDELGRGVDDLR